ncbi:hypothetical protein G4Y79_12885 [Phototrophicus methaneseepsis]|uniref:Uncharacterized protein n=1 Tax=Phototrophicus methaneseepsis TaxID=2710758 RepID=A0A7S8IDB2_9CHLR|nr:hypothetical protein [Phototrophicus methaneseepsis]QPC80608.1 hypothetical protein G4Y79_12885 [Phototrophicus methaneseepsis]
MALIATGTGLFWHNTGTSYEVTSLRGQPTQLYGKGLYRYDTLMIGAGFKGQDLVTLFLGIPLLIFSVSLSSGGSLIGHLLLMGTLGFFLYIYASLALGAAYNPLFLIYVVLLSACLITFALTFSAIDQATLAQHISTNAPHQELVIFMIISGLVTMVVWGAPLISALIKNTPPKILETYTTPVTSALDLAIITPATIISGVLIGQGATLGYMIAFPLLILIMMLVPLITLSTFFQKAAGVHLTRGEMIGPIAGFLILGLVAITLTYSLIQSISTVI